MQVSARTGRFATGRLAPPLPEARDQAGMTDAAIDGRQAGADDAYLRTPGMVEQGVQPTGSTTAVSQPSGR